KDAQSREMMLADPGRMEADRLGIERLVENVGDELVGAAPVIGIVVVAQREIAELHPSSFGGADAIEWLGDRRSRLTETILAPIDARPLQRLRWRPFVLFQLGARYQALPVGILRCRRGERISDRGRVGNGWRSGRRYLRPSRTEDGDGYGSRDADQQMLH